MILLDDFELNYNKIYKVTIYTISWDIILNLVL